MPGNSCCTNACTIVESSTNVRLRRIDGHRHHARQRARHLHDRQLAVAAERILAAQPHDEVEALVLDARKRPRRIEAQRAQHRLDLALEIIGKPGLSRQHSSLRGASRHTPVRWSAGRSTSFRQRYCSATSARAALVDSRQLLRRWTCRPGRSAAEPSSSSCFRPETRISKNSSRLFDVMHRNLQPLEQRHRFVERQSEHALIELEQRQLAVDEVLGRAQFRQGGTSPGARRRSYLPDEDDRQMTAHWRFHNKLSAVSATKHSCFRQSQRSRPQAHLKRGSA